MSRPQEGYAPSWKPLADPNFGAFLVLLCPLPLRSGSGASFSTCWGPRSWGSPCRSCRCWACGSLCRPRCTTRVHFPPGSASLHRCEAAGKRSQEAPWGGAVVVWVIYGVHCCLLSLLHHNIPVGSRERYARSELKEKGTKEENLNKAQCVRFISTSWWESILQTTSMLIIVSWSPTWSLLYQLSG